MYSQDMLWIFDWESCIFQIVKCTKLVCKICIIYFCTNTKIVVFKVYSAILKKYYEFFKS